MSRLPNAVVLLDEEWRLVYANETARRISHIEPENLKRGTLWEMYPQMVGTELERALREVARTGVERLIERYYYEPFDTWFNIRVLPMEGGVVLHYRGVTSILMAEAARDAAMEQLKEVLEATTDSVVRLDREWRIVYMNQHAEQFLATGGKALGTKIWESFPAAAYDGSPYVEHFNRAMEEGVPGEFDAYSPEPAKIWVHVLARPVRDGVIVFFRNVTQEKRALAALVQAEKLAAVGMLASSIAHEINNPLEAVTNIIYLAQQAEDLAEVKPLLEMADEELRRVSLIASHTLRFHKQLTKPQAITCRELLATVLGIYERRLKSGNIVIHRRNRARRPAVCFEGEIRQVLSNLVDNAMDAMPDGGRLLVRNREGTDWRSGRRGLVLTVADTGTGIPPETQQKIYDAFFTTKGAGGTGLGLWISAEIMERHQGRIRMRSSQVEGRSGSVFTLFLPFNAAVREA